VDEIDGVVALLGEMGQWPQDKSLREDRHRIDGRILLNWNIKKQLVDYDHLAQGMV
jgi:hypothetical protein